MKNPTTPEPASLSAGAAQFDVRLGDLDVNLDAAHSAIRELSDAGVNLAVLPEMWSSGFDNANLMHHAGQTPRVLDIVSEWSARYNMVIAGSLPEHVDDAVANTLFIIDTDGTLKGSYRKIHLFSPTGENRFFSAGKRRVVVDTSAGRLGLMICYDLRFPELCRTLALDGASIIVVSAQWPAARIRHWEILLQARAIENQLFVVAANRCGRDHAIDYGGSSAIVSPLGTVLARAVDGPQAISARLDRAELRDFRKRIPCFDERSPDSYR